MLSVECIALLRLPRRRRRILSLRSVHARSIGHRRRDRRRRRPDRGRRLAGRADGIRARALVGAPITRLAFTIIQERASRRACEQDESAGDHDSYRSSHVHSVFPIRSSEAARPGRRARPEGDEHASR